MRQEAEYLKVLGHPDRLRILRALERGERTVSELGAKGRSAFFVFGPQPYLGGS